MLNFRVCRNFIHEYFEYGSPLLRMKIECKFIRSSALNRYFLTFTNDALISRSLPFTANFHIHTFIVPPSHLFLLAGSHCPAARLILHKVYISRWQRKYRGEVNFIALCQINFYKSPLNATRFHSPYSILHVCVFVQSRRRRSYNTKKCYRMAVIVECHHHRPPHSDTSWATHTASSGAKTKCGFNSANPHLPWSPSTPEEIWFYRIGGENSIK